MQSYRLVFDAAQFEPSRWTILGVPLLLTFVGIVLVLFRGKPKVTWISNWPPHPVFAWFYFLFAATILVLLSVGMVGGWLEVRQAVAHKSFHVVAGRVADFKPMPRGGHANESFSVTGVHFSYSDFSITSGFNNTEAYGGPIHANSQVRLGYLCKPSESDCGDPIIIRVEILEPASRP